MPALQLAPILDQERNRLVYATASTVVETYALNEEDELAVAGLVEFAILDILTIADSLAAKRAELHAVRSRGDRHVATHRGCRRPGCVTLSAIRYRIEQLERQCEAEARRLRRAR